MESNLALGGVKVERGARVCLFTLALWQLMQVCAHLLTSFLMFGHTNFEVISFCELGCLGGRGCEERQKQVFSSRLAQMVSGFQLKCHKQLTCLCRPGELALV